MLHDRQRQLNYLRIIADLLVLVGSYLLTYLFFFSIIPTSSFFGGGISPLVKKSGYYLAMLYLIPLELLMYGIFRLYRPMRVTGRKNEAFKILFANMLSIFLIAIIFWLFIPKYAIGFSRVFLFEVGVFSTFFVVLERNLIRLVVVSYRKKGYNKKHILIVGYSQAAEGFLRRVQANGRWGYDVFGILDDNQEIGMTYRGYEVIGRIEKLGEILEQNTIDEVFVAIKLREYGKLAGIVSTIEKSGVQTKFIPDYGNLMSNHPYTEDLLGLPVVYIRRVPLDDFMNALLKRSVDIIGSLFALILFSPVLLFLTIAIPLTNRGPVIYKQERIGLHNKPFMMYKFRSMVVQKKEDEEKEWTKEADPRVTGIGKFIRKTSLDELPQLWNVLKGDMSLIGPRPERPQFVEKFKEEIPRYMIKHQVRPGMTGWAQINGYRGDTSIQKRIDCDLYYIENWTPELDIKILFLTFFKGFVNKNAY